MHSIPYRPPQLRCVIFPSIYLPHLHSISSDSYWASVCLATLPDIPCLICDFCPSDQRFAIRLPSDSTSRWTPLSLAMCFPLSGHTTVLHRLDYAHAGRTSSESPVLSGAFLFYVQHHYLETQSTFPPQHVYMLIHRHIQTLFMTTG